MTVIFHIRNDIFQYFVVVNLHPIKRTYCIRHRLVFSDFDVSPPPIMVNVLRRIGNYDCIYFDYRILQIDSLCASFFISFISYTSYRLQYISFKLNLSKVIGMSRKLKHIGQLNTNWKRWIKCDCWAYFFSV